MTEPCVFCSDPINPYDAGVFKQVTGWVGGPKQDSMTLREDTGKHACGRCISKLKLGQDPHQPDLLSDSPEPTSDNVPLPRLPAPGDPFFSGPEI